MSVENENRNCNCLTEDTNTSCNEQETIDNNMSCDCKNQMRKEMLEDIKALRFSVIDVSLYLDTHPNDKKALCLHRKYCNELKDLTDKYQKVFGPLTIEFPCNKWRWLEEPWPWEGGMQ